MIETHLGNVLDASTSFEREEKKVMHLLSYLIFLYIHLIFILYQINTNIMDQIFQFSLKNEAGYNTELDTCRRVQKNFHINV